MILLVSFRSVPLTLSVLSPERRLRHRSIRIRVDMSPKVEGATSTNDTKSPDDCGFGFLAKQAYNPPRWASHLSPIPSHTFSIAHRPTPIHKWSLPNLPSNTEVWLKRDDLSGMQLSGNKVRKLEFLMADALAQGADCIITIGGIQSNHCRATAVASKYLNLDCHLILRTSKVLVDKDPGLTGNLLVERLVGAHIHLVSKEEYAEIGSVALTDLLKEKLIKEGRRPYVIPVGGSNSLGTWGLPWEALITDHMKEDKMIRHVLYRGYIEAVREIEQQLQTSACREGFDYIVAACGSGATVAGLSLGLWLSHLKAKVHAFSVCDDPDYFYEYIQGLLDGLNAGVSSQDILNIQNAKGLGYAISSSEELQFVNDVAMTTGVVLDPVYSGKAAFGLVKDISENPEKWQGKKILFIHTGGLLGLYDKFAQVAPFVGRWQQMEIQDSVPRKHGVGKMF